MINTAQLVTLSGLSENNHHPRHVMEDTLAPRLLKGEMRLAVKARAKKMFQLNLGAVDKAKITLLAHGALSPLSGFMTEVEFRSVMSEMRLPNGAIWGLPFTLAVDKETAVSISIDQEIALCENGRILAVLEVTDKFAPPLSTQTLSRTLDKVHQNQIFIGGNVWVINLPESNSTIHNLQFTPAQTRRMFARRGWQRIAGFHSYYPLFRTHEYIQKNALELVDGLFILHNMTTFDSLDFSPAINLATYQIILQEYYPSQNILLTVFPDIEPELSSRNLINRALIHKNYGCTHFIINAVEHENFNSILDNFSPRELGITILPFDFTYFCTQCDMIVSRKTCPHGQKFAINYSVKEIKQMVLNEQIPPPEFIRSEVSALLTRAT